MSSDDAGTNGPKRPLQTSTRATHLALDTIDRVSNAAFITNPANKVIYWNDAASALYGIPAADTMGRVPSNIYKCFRPDKSIEQTEANSCRSDETGSGVLEQVLDTNEILRVELQVHGLQDESGTPIGRLHIVRKSAVTSEHQDPSRESQLDDSIYSALINAVGNGIVVLDRRGKPILANRAAEILLGAKADQMMNLKAIQRDGSPLPKKKFPALMALHTGMPQRDVMLGLRKQDGSVTWTLVNASPVTDTESGNVISVVVSYADITQQYASERFIKAALDREELVNEILESMRAEQDPELIQARVTHLIGRTLGLDRCYYATYDHEAGVIERGRDWHRTGLASVAGIQRTPEFTWVLDQIYFNGVSVIEDIRETALTDEAKAEIERMELRSAIAVPFYKDGKYVSAFVGGAAEPRIWTADDVLLMTHVAALTRSAVESARMSRRERNIAAQLQAAVQPEVPSVASGLMLAHHYRPAHDEAGVGGDFVDVFTGAEDATWLVVGDVSGKGLDAAVEVATVRNMLRFALFNGRTVAGPVAALNRTLAQNGLISGFASLFVAKYESGWRRLTFVNCGQDDGLLLHSDISHVTHLAPTGPVIGAFADSQYQEKSLTLAIGDVLALYTDGITEAGVSRKKMLAIAGMAQLLQNRAPYCNPQDVVSRIISGVDDHSRGNVRDDQALLVAIVTG